MHSLHPMAGRGRLGGEQGSTFLCCSMVFKEIGNSTVPPFNLTWGGGGLSCSGFLDSPLDSPSWREGGTWDMKT